ncbi:hypothetical protein VQ03_04785 [Methylobacterium tarhaniae]|uniref:Uncharacterized protein n=1 Tax=Methylobacterium tarhaniae TaxID=1187852 RepID=A0A0J6TAA1_9HYPH|nr:hypothetical protein [Methylobacterium tarhaniae]KMO44240.1 hypothetical protein VQ03_04785 [Methylobacterium tarhaniae]
MPRLGLGPPRRGVDRLRPLVVDERQGRPYAGDAFQREWRKVARTAGIPDHIWTMDARAGAITEAQDAGADLDARCDDTCRASENGYLLTRAGSKDPLFSCPDQSSPTRRCGYNRGRSIDPGTRQDGRA